MDKTGTSFSNNIYNNKYLKTWSLRLSTFSAKPKLMLAYSESIYHCCVLSWIQCFKCVFKFWRPYISLPMCKCFVDSLLIIVRNKTSHAYASTYDFRMGMWDKFPLYQAVLAVVRVRQINHGQSCWDSTSLQNWTQGFDSWSGADNQTVPTGPLHQINALWGSCNGKLEIGFFHFWERNISGIFGHG